MNISDVAKITGLTSKAIRFYEEKGLVTPPMRSENGYRTYTQNPGGRFNPRSERTCAQRPLCWCCRATNAG